MRKEIEDLEFLKQRKITENEDLARVTGMLRQRVAMLEQMLSKDPKKSRDHIKAEIRIEDLEKDVLNLKSQVKTEKAESFKKDEELKDMSRRL